MLLGSKITKLLTKCQVVILAIADLCDLEDCLLPEVPLVTVVLRVLLDDQRWVNFTDTLSRSDCHT